MLPWESKVANIRESGRTIYDPIEVGSPDLWLTSEDLEQALSATLLGSTDLSDLAIRTRSKVAKELVCHALGFEAPRTFNKVQPRFPCLNFDTYVQKANNLQVWNEELDATRRYVLIRLDNQGTIVRIKVVIGDELAKLDTTGTLTQKYQARITVNDSGSQLISNWDTDRLKPLTSSMFDISNLDPSDHPSNSNLLPIGELYTRLMSLVGKRFDDPGKDQERLRGNCLHELASMELGYKVFGENGQFPDIRNQLLEVKLQTSPTIDLGLVTPDSESALDLEKIDGVLVRHCDTRYLICYASIADQRVVIENVFLVTGQDFFNRFPRFGGKVLNKKIQIPLPANFFD